MAHRLTRRRRRGRARARTGRTGREPGRFRAQRVPHGQPASEPAGRPCGHRATAVVTRQRPGRRLRASGDGASRQRSCSSVRSFARSSGVPSSCRRSSSSSRESAWIRRTSRTTSRRSRERGSKGLTSRVVICSFLLWETSVGRGRFVGGARWAPPTWFRRRGPVVRRPLPARARSSSPPGRRDGGLGLG